MATTKKKEEQNQLEVQDVSGQNTSQQTGNGYQSKWQPQINEQVNQYLNRDKFQYDVNEDALYQQMKDMYVMQGRQAMMDTIGQSTALTGGYGNSWAQGAGQQAYQGYIQQLNDSIPELYRMALDQYINEGDQMAQNIGLMMDMESTDYNRYWDQMADQDAEYEKLLTLMTSYGYQPTEKEMASAGMSDAHMRAILGLDKKKSSGGTGVTGDDADTDDDTGDGDDYKVINQTNDAGVRVGNGGMSWSALEQAVKNGTVIEIVDDDKKTIQYIRADDKSFAGR